MSSTSYPDTYQAIQGAWINRQGTIICQQSNQCAQIVLGSTGWANEQVQATVLWSAGAAGLMLRYNNLSKSYYDFVAYPQSSVLQLELVNASLARSVLASYSSLPGISMTQDFVLRADAMGSNLRAWVNDIKYLDTTDTTLSAGQIGFDWQQGQGQFRDVNINISQPNGTVAPVTLPSEFGAYCSIDDVKGLLAGIQIADIATDDDIFQYIKESSDMINRATFSSFGRGIRVSERYDGPGSFSLVLDHSPIVKLHNCIVYNFNGTASRTFTSDDAENTASLIVEKNIGMLTIPQTTMTPTLLPIMWPSPNLYSPSAVTGTEYDYYGRFGRGVRNVLVDYEYGFETIPQQIRWACAKTVASLLFIKRGNKDTGGAVELSMEGLTINFTHRQGLSQPYGSVIEQFATEVKAAIQNYQRRPVKIL